MQGTIGQWLPVINLVGFLALVGSSVYFNMKNGTDQASAGTIKILKDKDEAQQGLINDQNKKIETLQQSVARMDGVIAEKDKKMEFLVQIFQGRDGQTQEFQKQGFLAIKEGRETLHLTKQNSKSLASLETMFGKFLKIYATHHPDEKHRTS